VLWLVENRQLLGELEGIDLLLQQLSVSEVITSFIQSFIRHCQHYYWQWKHLPTSAELLNYTHLGVM